MATQQYSASQRGGGSGETGRMRAAIVAKIDSWVQNANWHDTERAERMLDKLHEAPERFVSPNPDADHKEEASRIYEELKDEFGLRTEREAAKEARTYEDMAEAHYEGREDDETAETDETIDLADPTADGGETADETESIQGADDELVRDAVRSVGSGGSVDRSEANATEPEETAANVEETEQASILRNFAIVVSQRIGREARRSAHLAWVGLQALAPVVLAWVLTGVKWSAYGAGRLTVIGAKAAVFMLVLSVKVFVATVGLIVAVAVAFASGFAAAV